MTLKHQMINTIRSVRTLRAPWTGMKPRTKKTNETYFKVQQLTKKFRLRKAKGKGKGTEFIWQEKLKEVIFSISGGSRLCRPTVTNSAGI
jgi:hypothetical protein